MKCSPSPSTIPSSDQQAQPSSTSTTTNHQKRVHWSDPPITTSPPPSIAHRPSKQLPSVANHSQIVLSNKSGASVIPIFELWSNNVHIASIDKSAMSIIAEYFVNLHQVMSPRHSAIALMNLILGNYFNNFIDTRTSIVKQCFESVNQHNEAIIPVIANLSQLTMSSPNGLLEWQKMHLGMMHSIPSSMDIMIKRNLLLDIPTVVKTLHKHDKTCTCSVCILSKATKLPCGKVSDKSNLKPFERIHTDFSFFGCEPIQGFTTALDITCASTDYTLSFPTCSKSPPLEIVIWVVNTLRSMGHIVSFIRVDEDGSLAWSTEFKLVVMKQLMCLLEMTGPGDSANNGAVEVGNWVKANMVQIGLATMELLFGKDLPPDLSIEKFWCFTYQMAYFTLC